MGLNVSLAIQALSRQAGVTVPLASIREATLAVDWTTYGKPTE